MSVTQTVNLSVTVYNKQKKITDRFLKNEIPLKLWNYTKQKYKECIGENIEIECSNTQFLFYVLLDTKKNRLVVGSTRIGQGIKFKNRNAVILYYKHFVFTNIESFAIIRFNIDKEKYKLPFKITFNNCKIINLKPRDYYNELPPTPKIIVSQSTQSTQQSKGKRARTDNEDEEVIESSYKKTKIYVPQSPKQKGKEPVIEYDENEVVPSTPENILIPTTRKRNRDEASTSENITNIPKRQRPIAVARTTLPRTAPNPLTNPDDFNVNSQDLLELQINRTIAETNNYLEELRRRSIYRRYPNLNPLYRDRFIENNRPFGPDISTFITGFNINGRIKHLDLDNPIPFRETFGRYYLCYDGQEGHESFYIKRMKTAREYAEEQGISVEEFLNNIDENNAGHPPLWFLSRRFYIKPVWRKRGFIEFKNGNRTIGRINYETNWRNQGTGTKIYVADLMLQNYNYTDYRNRDIVNKLLQWKNLTNNRNNNAGQ